MYKYTADIDEDFGPTLKKIAERNGWDWRQMLQVMMSESGCRANAHNDNPKTKLVDGKTVKTDPAERYNAVGLIQFMPFVLKHLGFEAPEGEYIWEAFKRLTATQQLFYVEKYYAPYKNLNLNTAARFYQATFLPATLRMGSSPDIVLTAKFGFLGWAYTPNASFDVNKDLKITVGELEGAIQRASRGPRYAELCQRVGGFSKDADEVVDMFDLGTREGLQNALARLGFYEGKVDGIWGPKSDSAVRKFQKEAKLVVDGIVGPLTRKAIQERLPA